MGGIDLFALLEFERADFEHVPGAIIEEPDNLLIEGIDGLAVLGDVHEGWGVSAACWPTGAAPSSPGMVSVCVNCSGGAVARPGSTVSKDSGLVTGTLRSSSAAGRSSRLRKPKYSRKRAVV